MDLTGPHGFASWRHGLSPYSPTVGLLQVDWVCITHHSLRLPSFTATHSSQAVEDHHPGEKNTPRSPRSLMLIEFYMLNHSQSLMVQKKKNIAIFCW